MHTILPDIVHASRQAVNAMLTLAQGPLVSEEGSSHFEERAAGIIRDAILANPIVGGGANMVDGRVLMRQFLDGFSNEEREGILEFRRSLKESNANVNAERLLKALVIIAVYLGMSAANYKTKDPLTLSIVRVASGAILPDEGAAPCG